MNNIDYYPISKDFQNREDILITIHSNEKLENTINETIKNYQTIDIGLGLNYLTIFGGYLKLAHAGSVGFACNSKVNEILTAYHLFIRDASNTVYSFVDTCVMAMQYHKKAIELAEKNLHELSFIRKCSELATQLFEEINPLIGDVHKIKGLSLEVLHSSQNDENVPSEEKEEIMKLLNEFSSRQVVADENSKKLFKQVNDLRNFKLEITKTLIQQLNNQFAQKTSQGDQKSIFEANLQSIMNQELEILNLRTVVESEERDINVQLAIQCHRILNTKLDNNDLVATTISLQMIVLTLSRVKGMFNLAYQQLLGIKTQLEKLLSTDFNVDSIDMREQFVEKLKISGLAWLSFGKLYYTLMEEVGKKSEEIKNFRKNLPNKAEAIEVVNRDADRLLKRLTS